MHCITASQEWILCWQYKTGSGRLQTSLFEADPAHRLLFRLDDLTAIGIEPQDRTAQRQRLLPSTDASATTKDQIVHVCTNEQTVFLLCASGTVIMLKWPQMAVQAIMQVPQGSTRLRVNCNTTFLSVLDDEGNMAKYKIDVAKNQLILVPETERKDVWDMAWAEDDPTALAYSKKSRLYVQHGAAPEEPLLRAGYISGFKDLSVALTVMDDIMEQPRAPAMTALCLFELDALRQTKQLLQAEGPTAAHAYVQQQHAAFRGGEEVKPLTSAHRTLWALLADDALRRLALEEAMSFYAKSGDYRAILFVKSLKWMQHQPLQQEAEVLAYFGEYDKAEETYRSIDRNDLAIAMRSQIGDISRVSSYLASDAVAQDAAIEQAYREMGDQLWETQAFADALPFYQRCRHWERLAEGYYRLEQFDALIALTEDVPPGHKVLSLIGEYLVSVGLCAEAVAAFQKVEDTKAAIQACMHLNRWDVAGILEGIEGSHELEEMVTQSADALKANGRLFEAIDMYRKANRHWQAGELLSQLADHMLASHGDTLSMERLCQIQKLYVLSACELARVENVSLHAVSLSQQALAKDPWRKARAFYYFIKALCGAEEDKSTESLHAALIASRYEHLLPRRALYALLALTALKAGYYATCSGAFGKLALLSPASSRDVADLLPFSPMQHLAMHLFVDKAPFTDPPVPSVRCQACGSSVSETVLMARGEGDCPTCEAPIPLCLRTGRPLSTAAQSWRCTTCHHSTSFSSEMEEGTSSERVCALCHFRTDQTVPVQAL